MHTCIAFERSSVQTRQEVDFNIAPAPLAKVILPTVSFIKAVKKCCIVISFCTSVFVKQT